MSAQAKISANSSQSHFWQVSGLTTHARLYGPPEAKPIVVVAGLGCASWMYRRLACQLAVSRRVYVYDHLAHGRSQQKRNSQRAGSCPKRIAELTDHLAAWLELAGLQEAPLLGHSLGGEVAFDLAARYQTPPALVVCAPTGIPENPSVRRQFWRMVRDLPLERPQLLPYGLAAYCCCGLRCMLALARDQVRHNTGILLPQIVAPTLLINGEADNVIRNWTVRDIQAKIPKATICEIPSGPHAITDSHPRAVARYTLDFLRSVGI